MELENYLSRNIRYLRKSRQWSQEELAMQLEIKRSNIAAYESKNVEPRLSLILRMARLFDVNMAELIHVDIAGHGGIQQPFLPPALEELPGKFPAGLEGQIDPQALEDFVRKSLSVRKMLEGFRIFYRYKQEAAAEGKADGQADVDNFLHLIDHMVSLNESFIELLQSGGKGME